MIARHPMPPPADGLALTLRRAKRFLISERNSFETVQELQRRERRVSSLLNHGGFLLTGANSPLGLPRPAMEKLKEGLTHAIRLTDRLADVDGSREIVEQLCERACPPVEAGLRVSWRTYHDKEHHWRFPEPQDVVLRAQLLKAYDKQKAIIQGLSTSELAWLLTLSDGAAMGFQRYTVRKYKNAGARAVVNLAFEETVLRYGSSVLWAFVRGDKSESRFWRKCLANCICEIRWWEHGGMDARTETGGKLVPDGLHMTIMRELSSRFIKEIMESMSQEKAEKTKKEEEDEDEDDDAADGFDPADFTAADTWTRVNRIIREEVGSELWLGYVSAEWPTAFVNLVNNAPPTASTSLS